MDAFDASPLCPSPIELQLHAIVVPTPELIVTAIAWRRGVGCLAGGHAARASPVGISVRGLIFRVMDSAFGLRYACCQSTFEISNVD